MSIGKPKLVRAAPFGVASSALFRDFDKAQPDEFMDGRRD
jgi:hypothetical protein